MTSVMPRRKTKPKPVDMENLVFRLSRSKVKLVLDHPFFGVISMRLPVVWTDKVPTAAVDGRKMYFNPEFVTGLSDDELVFLVAHECMHLMLNHCTRRGNRDPKRWNYAGDYLGNELLVRDGIGTMPNGGLFDSTLTQNGTLTTEQIYDLLPEDIGGDEGDEDGPLDEVMDSTDPELEQETKVLISQAAQAAEMAGKLSAGLKRLVGELVHPKVSWRDVLRDFMTKTRDADRTFARPNRRLRGEFILPSVTGERVGEIVVAVDCSGSINDKVINEFASEITALHTDLHPERVHVLYFDTKVLRHDEFEDDDTVSMSPCGGGGTAFSPIFKFIDEQGIDPQCCVVLTDLCCNDFGSEPTYPVLWVSNGQTKAPWGQVVKM